MTQIHIVLRRVNPALDIDLAQVGYVKDGQFEQLPVTIFSDTPIFDYFRVSDISKAPYVNHQSIAGLVTVLASRPNFAVEFFDNTVVFMFDFNFDCNEISSKEEGERN